ncbi:hypothetical protein PTSG_09324 [Salpingoeca rosetta]|uniref:Uncharacterized protein n=1 Tax=Salpingoeca rosetta (strain ATCC 50818 / BSB-021) TaxID=946362 RepID=F2UMB0_SALR5|nr:uncharacterized protein PTSG_09324 [Salpingoeca rosetta]EGD78259.1 hypothetical protein PTSG_09324 [Salpingoeca rosetta]|eukprot:XP_004989582.1 hypothetical protein PTSG_09324 [Salpingoeca rosetta]
MGNTCGGGGKQGKGVKSIESFPVVYVGTMSLPATAYAGVDACYHVVTTLNQERSRQTQGNGDENGHGGDDDDDDDEMGPEAGHNQATSTDPEEEDFSAHLDEGLKDVKAVLTVSIYGIKALVG